MIDINTLFDKAAIPLAILAVAMALFIAYTERYIQRKNKK
jgi:hypothetical protein